MSICVPFEHQKRQRVSATLTLAQNWLHIDHRNACLLKIIFTNATNYC